MKHYLKDLTDHDIHQALQSPHISKDRLDAIRTERERRELLAALQWLANDIEKLGTPFGVIGAMANARKLVSNGTDQGEQ